LAKDPTEKKAMRLFGFSITYVTIIFVAMAVDVLV
jgi:heme O synthase-like polyprenyltransferase